MNLSEELHKIITTPHSVDSYSGLNKVQGLDSIMALYGTNNSQIINNHIYQPGDSIP